MAKDLTTFYLEDPIFVDANVLEGDFPDKPFAANCKYFLKRIEDGHINAATSVQCINEALYRRLISVGIAILKPSVKDKAKKVRGQIEKDGIFAKDCYSEVKIFLDYLLQLHRKGLQIIDYILNHQVETVDLAIAYGLTFNFTDATYLHICMAEGINHIATSDGNFERNPFGFEIWKP